MLKSKGLFVLTSVAVAALGFVLVSQAMAQDSRPARQGRGNFDPAQMQQRMDQARTDRAKQMQTDLGVSDDEWKVLQPKIDKVQQAQRDARGGMMGMGGPGGRGNRGNRGGPGADPTAQPAADAAPQTDLQKASAALGKVLENKEAKAEDIKAALTALRDARAKAKAELEKAQKDLKDVLTTKQEAQLVMRGLLE